MTAYVQNLWYMAAWTDEVPEDGLLPRTLLGKKRIIFKTSDGFWAMLADRCPHRFVELSKGAREKDIIRCPYHGLAFDRVGNCVDAPFGGTIPSLAKVETLPIVERHQMLWFWPGDPELADPSLIPDFSFAEGPNHAHAYMHMSVNYELIADNLLDLTHIEFIHAKSFGTNGAMMNHGVMKVTSDLTGTVWCNWDIVDAPPTDEMKRQLPEGAHMDHWLHVRWQAPACLGLFIGFAQTGTERQRHLIPEMTNPHILTPETQSTSHYFFTHAPGEDVARFAHDVFRNEDELMIRSSQDGFDGQDFWEARPVILAGDAGAIRARRHLMKLRREEAQRESVAPTTITEI